MPEKEEVNFEEVLIAPLEAIVRKIAASVAEAQLKLDEAALETQEKLKDNYPELAKVRIYKYATCIASVFINPSELSRTLIAVNIMHFDKRGPASVLKPASQHGE